MDRTPIFQRHIERREKQKYVLINSDPISGQNLTERHIFELRKRLEVTMRLCGLQPTIRPNLFHSQQVTLTPASSRLLNSCAN